LGRSRTIIFPPAKESSRTKRPYAEGHRPELWTAPQRKKQAPPALGRRVSWAAAWLSHRTSPMREDQCCRNHFRKTVFKFRTAPQARKGKGRRGLGKSFVSRSVKCGPIGPGARERRTGDPRSTEMQFEKQISKFGPAGVIKHAHRPSRLVCLLRLFGLSR